MHPIVITSDKTSWSLRPLLYLIERHWPAMLNGWPQPSLTIGGYSHPAFDLPWWTRFMSLGHFEDYPVNKWTNGLIQFLHLIDDEYILFLMDDYWLNRRVEVESIEILTDYLKAHEWIARLDLTSDRLGAAHWHEHDRTGGIDLILSDPLSPYHFSYQAALWRKSLLLDCLETGETPWQSEIAGDARLRNHGYLVIGTKQPPLRYTIAVQKGHLAIDGGYQGNDYALPAEDAQHIVDRGWIPAGLIEKSAEVYT